MSAGRTTITLLILRLGLGVFLLLWSIDKLVAPQGAVNIFQFFYDIGISINVAYVLGVLELVVSLAIIAGLLKTYSYGLGLLVHATSTAVSYQQLLEPFGSNRVFIAGIPVLAAFIALFLLRRQDTLLSVDRLLGR